MLADHEWDALERVAAYEPNSYWVDMRDKGWEMEYTRFQPLIKLGYVDMEITGPGDCVYAMRLTEAGRAALAARE